jgi:uncharacterized protein YcbK (DUF882 family)
MHSKIEAPSSRRLFLKGLVCGGATLAMAGAPGIASASKSWLQSPRKLAFHNLHTAEKLSLTYFEDGQYVSGAVQELNNLLRDHRSGDAYNMDPALFDLLHALQASLGGNKTFQVISGYRSPATNQMLNKNSSGVAKKSLHMLGKAIDIRVPGVESKIVQQASIALKQGGVGLYRKSNFVHIDTGNVRHW